MGMDIGSIVSGAGAGMTAAGPWGALAGGLLGAFGGGGKSMSPEEAARAADPYYDYRRPAAAKLDALMNNPNSVTNMPGFKFLQQQGQQGVERAMSARGGSVSGNEMLALQEQDQGLANKFYQQEFNNLAMLSGASQGPAAGGQAAIQQSQYNNKVTGQGIGALSELFSQGVSNVQTGGLSNLFGTASKNQGVQFNDAQNWGYGD